MQGSLILTTYPDAKTAAESCEKVVRDHLAACASIFQVKSIYRWKGKLEVADESMVIFKTAASSSKRLRQRLEKTHPYEVPEIIEVSPKSIGTRYLRWVTESVKED